MESLNVKLQIQDLSISMNNKTILQHISFDVYEGEFLSILGPSGCGKTTILRLLAGLLPLTDGCIIKEGQKITTLPPSARGMGIVFQDYALFENMTVLENVEYALKVNKKFKHSAHKISIDMMELVGLTDHMNKRPYQLSGGQQQRTAIARTLALKPDIILFDEPMAALDADSRNSLRIEIKNIQRKFGNTVIYVTHDQEEAFSMSDRIIIMGENKIHQIDTPHHIIQQPADGFVQKFVLDNLKQKLDSLYEFIGELP